MLSRICRILSTLLMIAMVLLVLIMVGPLALQWKSFVVLTGSMDPAIPPGSLIYTKTVESYEVLAGDVITFSNDGGNTMVTHRVIENNLAGKFYITQGDANNITDGEIPYENLVGKMMLCFPYIGAFALKLKSSLGIAMIAAWLLFLGVLLFLPDMMRGGKAEPPKKKAHR